MMSVAHSLAPIVCLASASPRRRELLSQIGVPHIVTVADIDETAMPQESPRDYVTRLARQKALAVQARGAQLPVLAADTTVVLGDKILGKPRDREEGLAMLEQLSGREHEVMTAVALAHTGAPIPAVALSRTDALIPAVAPIPVNIATLVRVSLSIVRFREITVREREAYWATGEPADKAGGYAIQGRGAVFIESMSGSYSGVMGLPLYETAELLRAARVPCWEGSLEH